MNIDDLLLAKECAKQIADNTALLERIKALEGELAKSKACAAEMRNFLKTWLPVFPLNDWLAERDKVVALKRGGEL